RSLWRRAVLLGRFRPRLQGHPGNRKSTRRPGEGMGHAVVERIAVSVLYVVRRDSLPQAPKDAFEELERKVGSLRGRKFYGVFYAADDEYRACVEPKPEDNAAALRLSDGVIPGGRYARDGLRGDPPEVDSGIPRPFGRL